MEKHIKNTALKAIGAVGARAVFQLSLIQHMKDWIITINIFVSMQKESYKKSSLKLVKSFHGISLIYVNKFVWPVAIQKAQRAAPGPCSGRACTSSLEEGLLHPSSPPDFAVEWNHETWLCTCLDNCVTYNKVRRHGYEGIPFIQGK